MRAYIAYTDIFGARGAGHSSALTASRPRGTAPQLPFKTPQIPSNRDRKALNRGTLEGLASTKTMWSLGLDMISNLIRSGVSTPYLRTLDP